MAFISTDISFVYSGGSGNNNPNSSLGSDPSSYPISGAINNIFSDITEQQATAGYTDYRCIYVFNDNSVDTLYDCVAQIQDQLTGGSNISIGVKIATEVQKINISGTMSGGSLTLSYEGDNFTANYNADLNIFAQNIETALNALDSLSGTSVTSVSGGFEIIFSGFDDNKSHELIQLVTNNLTGAPTVSVTRITSGAPINSIAEYIGSATNPPTSVVFGNSAIIGSLQPSDGFPIWIKRVTPANTSAIANDNFFLSIVGTPVEPT